MRILRIAAAALFLAPTALCAEPLTESGNAYVEVRQADRKDGKLTVELRFLTDYQGYSGEEIYSTPADIHVEAGGTTYALAQEDGAPMAPESLSLKFNYDPSKNPRVGTWEGTFDAPPAEVAEAVLHLPNVEPVPLAIRDKVSHRR